MYFTEQEINLRGFTVSISFEQILKLSLFICTFTLMISIVHCRLAKHGLVEFLVGYYQKHQTR